MAQGSIAIVPYKSKEYDWVTSYKSLLYFF